MRRALPGLWIACLLAACSSRWLAAPQAEAPTPSPYFITATPTPTQAPSLTPTLPPSPTPCGEMQGRLEQMELASASLPSALVVRLYLPPCYDPASPFAYPVLILLHGQGYKGDQWERLGVGEAASRLIMEERFTPFLIVLPEEADTNADTYTSAFGPVLVEELLPWLDSRYPTCAQRGCRAIGGISRGAAWAVQLGIEHWQIFGAVGAHSLPTLPGMERRLEEQLRRISPGELPLFYLDTGWGDRYRKAASQFEELLNRKGVPHEWYLNAGAHDDAYWQAHVEEYLRWYASVFASAQTP